MKILKIFLFAEEEKNATLLVLPIEEIGLLPELSCRGRRMEIVVSNIG